VFEASFAFDESLHGTTTTSQCSRHSRCIHHHVYKPGSAHPFAGLGAQLASECRWAAYTPAAIEARGQMIMAQRRDEAQVESQARGSRGGVAGGRTAWHLLFGKTSFVSNIPLSYEILKT